MVSDSNSTRQNLVRGMPDDAHGVEAAPPENLPPIEEEGTENLPPVENERVDEPLPEPAMPDIQTFKRLGSLPVVATGWEQLGSLIGATKEANKFAAYGLNVMESSLKYGGRLAIPVVNRFERPGKMLKLFGQKNWSWNAIIVGGFLFRERVCFCGGGGCNLSTTMLCHLMSVKHSMWQISCILQINLGKSAWETFILQTLSAGWPLHHLCD